MLDTVRTLLAGNAEHANRVAGAFDHLQQDQHPDAVTVCCADSRVLQDDIWDNDEPGRLFTCSNIGNRVVQRTDAGTVVAGDVLYPLVETGTEVAMVVGHTGCGAVTATYDAVTDGSDGPPGIEHCIELLAPAVRAGVAELPSGIDRAEAVNRLVERNVDHQVERLRESPAVPSAVTVVGAVYDFQDVYGGRRGEVHVVNVDGVRDPDALRETAVADRVARRWDY